MKKKEIKTLKISKINVLKNKKKLKIENFRTKIAIGEITGADLSHYHIPNRNGLNNQ